MNGDKNGGINTLFDHRNTVAGATILTLLHELGSSYMIGFYHLFGPEGRLVQES